MSDARPKYFDKHPCASCAVGYGECAQGYVMALMCCKNCNHPSLLQPNPWSDEDLGEFAAINAARQS